VILEIGFLVDGRVGDFVGFLVGVRVRAIVGLCVPGRLVGVGFGILVGVWINGLNVVCILVGAGLYVLFGRLLGALVGLSD
jgi:hypothetical protein